MRAWMLLVAGVSWLAGCSGGGTTVTPSSIPPNAPNPGEMNPVSPAPTDGGSTKNPAPGDGNESDMAISPGGQPSDLGVPPAPSSPPAPSPLPAPSSPPAPSS